MTRHVVVVGGGFAGLSAARMLRKSDVRVTLIDRRNHHLFQPLLYQVATAALAPSDIAEPIRAILGKQANAEVRLAEAREVDLAGRRLRVAPVGQVGGPEWLSYDYLVLALGVQQSWFGNDAWETRAPGLKTLRDALEIRRRVLLNFERAEWIADPEERERLLTFVVVGAGATGVELAGALSEIAMRSFPRDFRRMDTRKARVVLVEAGPAVLPPYSEPLREAARRQLTELGVEVRTGSPVELVDDDGVVVAGERIRAATVLWAAGVAAPPITRTLGVPLDRAGRVIVNPDCTVPGHPEVFVTGDLATIDLGGGPLPGVATVALAMGRHAGAAIRAEVAGKPRPTFRFFDRGSLATVGRKRAVLEWRDLRISGVIAWLIWVFVHLMVLVTYRTRMVVFVKWAWAWLTYERSSRLVWQTEPDPGTYDEEEPTCPTPAAEDPGPAAEPVAGGGGS